MFWSISLQSGTDLAARHIEEKLTGKVSSSSSLSRQCVRGEFWPAISKRGCEPVFLSACWPPILLVGKLLNRIREKQCLHWWVRRPFFRRLIINWQVIQSSSTCKLNWTAASPRRVVNQVARKYSTTADYRTAWRPAQHRLAKQNNFLIIPSEQ